MNADLIPSDPVPSDSSFFEGGPRPPMDTPHDASTLAVKIFLVSLTMLFGATMVGYLVTRLTSDGWGAYQIDGMAAGLVLSTVVIFGISGSFHLGIRAIANGNYRGLNVWLTVASVFSVVFLVNQIVNWRALLAVHGSIKNTPDLSLFLFYGMTFLHALHVVGGYAPLAITTRKAYNQDYFPSDFRGVYNCALYWHFIDVVWVLMAVAFLIG